MGGEGDAGALTGLEFVVAGSGDHGGVVGRERGGREEGFEPLVFGGFDEALAEKGIARHSSRDKDRVNAANVRRGERARDQILDHGALEARDQVEGRRGTTRAQVLERGTLDGLAPSAAFLGFPRKFGSAHAVKHRGLETRKAEIQRIPFHLDAPEIHPVGISVARQPVDNRPAGVPQGQELCDLIEGFACGVVAAVAELGVSEGVCGVRAGRGEEQARMPPGGHQREGGKGCLSNGLAGRAVHLVFEQNGVDVTFQVVHADQRLAEGKRQRFAIDESDQERADQSRPFGDGEGVHGADGQVGLPAGLLDHRLNLAQMFAGGEFGDHASIFFVGQNLGGHDAGTNFRAVRHHRRGRFIATGFNAEHQHAHTLDVHLSIGGAWRPSRRKAEKHCPGPYCTHSLTWQETSGYTKTRAARGSVRRGGIISARRERR